MREACLLTVKMATDAFGQVFCPSWKATKAHGLVSGSGKPLLSRYCGEQGLLEPQS